MSKNPRSRAPEAVRRFLSEIGRKGGRRRSKAKTRAARENGKYGRAGKPRTEEAR